MSGVENENKRSSAAEQIGQKIKKLRLSEGMTQKELAGDVISRNMLSMIESGNALPSLETLLHISEMLSVSAGFFFADESETKLFGKRQSLENIYRLIENGEYETASKLCLEYADDDTEIRALLVWCYIKTAEEFVSRYMLASAKTLLNSAMKYAETIPYIGSKTVRACTYAALLFDSVSKDTIPYELTDFERFSETDIPYSFMAFLSAYRSLKKGDVTAASAIERSGMTGEFYSLHIRGGILMASDEYGKAALLLDSALKSGNGGFFSRYKLLCDLEICRKNTGDYEKAYALSTARMDMLGMFSR